MIVATESPTIMAMANCNNNTRNINIQQPAANKWWSTPTQWRHSEDHQFKGKVKNLSCNI